MRISLNKKTSMNVRKYLPYWNYSSNFRMSACTSCNLYNTGVYFYDIREQFIYKYMAHAHLYTLMFVCTYV